MVLMSEESKVNPSLRLFLISLFLITFFGEEISIMPQELLLRLLFSSIEFVVLLKNSVSQMIYKHAISTVVPSRPVKFHIEGADDADTKGPGNE